MMCYGDIHESQMFPIREPNLLEILKQKFPFNRFGIDTTVQGVERFVDDIISRVLNFHKDEVLERLKTPVN